MSRTLSLADERGTRFAERAPAASVIEDVAAILAIAACAVVLHRDGLFGGPAFYELDTRLFYFPLAQWVAQQLHAGVYPLWLPSIFTGYPIFADGELGLAYLPQIALLFLLPTPLAIAWLRALHVFFAGLFTFLYLRNLRLETVPALGGALVFALGSFLSAQMHHENVVRSAVWLPAVLLCLDRALATGTDRRRFAAWTAVGALAFSQSALGLHIQPVLMLALGLGIYALFRAVVPAWRPMRALIAAGATVCGGLAVAAVQWVPLGEWALVSSRRGGVDYEFASAFGIAPESLSTLLFPFFFRLPDATTWWSLWQQWETELYVGIPTLALALVGVVLSRRIEVVYFVLLGLGALWIAMAQYAPLLNLHLLLWGVPGFSFLRAPGRFTYLVVFSAACLAALGLQRLSARRRRGLAGLLGATPPLAVLAASLALLPIWRGWLLGDAARAQAFVNSTYLGERAQYPIDPQLVVSGLASSLDVTNPKTAWSLALLGLTGVAFLAWFGLGTRRARLTQTGFVLLIAVDLLVFASDFHPRAPLDSLAPPRPAGLDGGGRVLLREGPDLPAFEPNQLLADGVATTDGYSSLPSQRHVELQASTSAEPQLLDLWSAPLILEPSAPPDLHVANAVRFRAQHPLAAVFGGSAPQAFTLSSGDLASVRLIATLSYAFNVPQGEPVATVALDGVARTLRAGVDLSERAYDRPSLNGLVRHEKARVAYDFEEATSEGEAYIAHFYEADLDLGAPRTYSTMTIGALDPNVLVEVYGIGVVGADGKVVSLDLADRDGFRRASEEVIRDAHALPRAYLLPRAQAFSPARHPNLTSTQLVANPDVDLHTMVLIENDPETPREPGGSLAAVPARVEDLGPNGVRVFATADAPSYLVLDDFYHRGWTATVDGQSTRVFIANALFRAVELEPGSHVVEFRFAPLSVGLGLAVSALSLLACLVVAAWGLTRR